MSELGDAWIWYEDRQTGLGTRLKSSVFDAIKQIESSPAKAAKKNGMYRETRISVFPYLIIYSIDKDRKQVFIHSIFHTRRNPLKKYTIS